MHTVPKKKKIHKLIFFLSLKLTLNSSSTSEGFTAIEFPRQTSTVCVLNKKQNR